MMNKIREVAVNAISLFSPSARKRQPQRRRLQRPNRQPCRRRSNGRGRKLRERPPCGGLFRLIRSCIAHGWLVMCGMGRQQEDGGWPSGHFISGMTQITVLSGGAMRRFMAEAIPLFEQAAGAKVSIRFALTRLLKKGDRGGRGIRYGADAAGGARRARGEPARSPLAVRPTWCAQSSALWCAPARLYRTSGQSTRSSKSCAKRSRFPSAKVQAAFMWRRSLERLGLSGEMSGQDRCLQSAGPSARSSPAARPRSGCSRSSKISPWRAPIWSGRCQASSETSCRIRPGSPRIPKTRMPLRFVAFLASPEAVRIIRAKGMEPA